MQLKMVILCVNILGENICIFPGVPVTDLQWNPFSANSNELAVGLENGNVNIWDIKADIPCIGSKSSEEFEKEGSESIEDVPKLADLSPVKQLNVGNGKKVTQIRYNPTASGFVVFILDMNLKI
jgi:WD40 repeat protein